MKKHLSIVLLTALSSTALANGMLSKGKFDVGVAVGAGMSQTNETLIVSLPSASYRDGYRYTLKQSGPVGGITAGYTIQHNHNTFGLMVGAYRDFYTARNSGKKIGFIRGAQPSFTKDLKRKYTLEVAGKIGRNLSADLNLYAKFGALYSQFREQYKDTTSSPVLDIRKNLGAWGGVAGAGLQKSYESFNLGVEYDYHYYERMGSTMNYVSGGIPGNNKSKIRPQYHQVFLKISKSF